MEPPPVPGLPPVGRPQQRPLPPPRREHQVEVVAHVLVEVCHKVVVVSKVQVYLVVIVVVGIYVIVNVEN